MRHSGCGTAPGRPPGLSLLTSLPPPSSTAFSAAPVSASTSVLSASSISFSHWCRPSRSKCGSLRCATPVAPHSCLHGSARQRGCELNLFQPKKLGNFDCTFCLDCVHSCSHGNVGLIAIAPGASILKDRRLSRRRDVTVLAGVSVFGAFISAAVMTGPVMIWLHQWHARLGSMLAATTLFYVAGLVLVPGLLVFLCGRAKPELTGRFLLALVPLGFSMWLAHFCYHLVTGWNSVIPVVERIRSTLATGVSTAGALPSWMPPFEILALDAGLLLSLYLAWRIACSQSPAGERCARTDGSLGDPRRRALLGRTVDPEPANGNAWHGDEMTRAPWRLLVLAAWPVARPSPSPTAEPYNFGKRPGPSWSHCLRLRRRSAPDRSTSA